MPLEIREFSITVNVTQPSSPGQAAVNAVQTGAGDDKEKLLKDTIEQVMKILESKNER